MLGLVLSDIHGRIDCVKEIKESIHNKNLDFCLILGDLTNFGDRRVTEVLEVVGIDKCFAIPGNLDSWETLKEMESIGISIHKKSVKLGNFKLTGFGGGLQNEPGQVLFSEQEIEETLEKLVDENTILATHLPPKDTKIDLASNGMHIGSEAVGKVVRNKQPALHLCGHAHDAFGELIIGKTKSVNVGAVKEGRAVLLEIGNELSIESLKV
jgi:Icc-related predicted phosphoesterase